ncbi:MAG TPA: thioether cross-link-forming SCIFF peptide maturase [Oscillospiraceae bacterium]|nr:thioether cross-link-forming SCIFF peptide maturase [Oscillospiraceae bacterium]HPK34181.1 thioether cross-link-forming SCIFF peptide maturase [Oscillospiraceae bacterium]HPR74916.1 thioether cross-link-forming SCIFF peptide maturase [Oscillospiraceae bacterium]
MLHKYELNGYRIAIDTNSGAVHVLDKLAYDLLDYASFEMGKEAPEEAYQLGSREDVDVCWSELGELRDRGELFCPDDKRLSSFRTASAPVKSMCLLIAHDCNMKCEYCFADEGCYGGKRNWLPEETAKAAIDFLIEKSGSRHNLEVDFFGGEPLLNFGVVKSTVEYARSLEQKHNKNFRFTITTNGVLLDDDNIEFINREMSNVVMSLDGRKEIHDRIRTKKDGSGTYDAIVPKFQKLVSQRENNAEGKRDYYLRGTFTRHNLDFSNDVFHIAGLGVDQISVEPVVAPDSAPYSLRKEDLPRIFTEYETLAKRIVEDRKNGGYFNFFHFMIDLEGGPCAIKRVKGCGCGNEYVAVAANGDIYPCHQFVGVAGKKMGNVLDGSFDQGMKSEFAKADIFAKTDCQNCWAKFYCSGGCNANNFLYRGDILKPYEISCEMERKRVECAVMIKAALADEEKENDGGKDAV